MKKSALYYVLMFTVVNLYSQPKNWFYYKIPSNIPNNYQVNIDSEYNTIKKSNVIGLTARQKEDFAQTIAFAKYITLTGGNIYYGMEDIENYLNSIMKRVLPETLRTNNSIKVYINRDPTFNAYAIHDGTFFFNIGALADMKDEAQIAYIMGHEISHYLLEHSLLGYVSQIRQETFWGNSLIWGRRTRLQCLEYNRQQEYDADSLGIILAHLAGYDPKAELEVTSFMADMEGEPTKKKLRLEKFSTHPRSLLRYEKERVIINRLKTNDKKRHIVKNESEFLSFLKNCKQERLNLLLTQNKHNMLITEGMEYCFEYLQNTYGSYLVAEAIRRKIYMDKLVGKQPFLVSSNGNSKIDALETKELENNFIGSLKIAEKSFFDTKIETYTDAYNFFIQKALKEGYPEAPLCIALFNYQDKKVRDKYLTMYLNQNDILYRDYALALINNPEIPHKQVLTIIQPIRYTLLKGKFRDDNYTKFNSVDVANHLQQKTQAFMNKKAMERKVLFYSYSTHDNATFPLIQRALDIYECMYKFYQRDILTRKLSILDPSIWDFYNKNNIKSIEFQSFNYSYKVNSKYRKLFWLPPFTLGYGMYNLYYTFLTHKLSRGMRLDVDYYTLNVSEKYANVYSLHEFYSKKLTPNNIARVSKKFSSNSDKIKSKSAARLIKEKIK